MTDTSQYPLFADLPALTEDELDDATFRGRDRAWVALAGLFDELAEGGLTYKALGDRLQRSKSQVQRWLACPQNMTLQSMSLLAEGLDADLTISLRRRLVEAIANQCHPAEAAKAYVDLNNYLSRGVPMGSANNSTYLKAKWNSGDA